MKAVTEARDCEYRLPVPTPSVPDKKWLKYCENERIEQSLRYYECENESKYREKVRSRLRKSVISKSALPEEEEEEDDEEDDSLQSGELKTKGPDDTTSTFLDSPMSKGAPKPFENP